MRRGWFKSSFHGLSKLNRVKCATLVTARQCSSCALQICHACCKDMFKRDRRTSGMGCTRITISSRPCSTLTTGCNILACAVLPAWHTCQALRGVPKVTACRVHSGCAMLDVPVPRCVEVFCPGWSHRLVRCHAHCLSCLSLLKAGHCLSLLKAGRSPHVVRLSTWTRTIRATFRPR